MSDNIFYKRHIGISPTDEKQMLETIGVTSLDALIEETIPASIRLFKSLNLPDPLTEAQYLQHMQELANQNSLFQSHIGQGYYGTYTPSVILRNIFENPSWYTAYTPYQAEIAQGRMEALLNYQTMVCQLTAMPLANASLLDEATAAAEGMTMLYSMRSKEQVKNNKNVFFVDENAFPTTIDVLKTRAQPIGIQVVIGDITQIDAYTNEIFGVYIQYPSKHGELLDYTAFVDKIHAHNAHVVVGTDLLALTLFTPPGEWGADVVVGTSQRFGVPMGYGGPHAAFFATREEFKRFIPGRIIGVSIDIDGNRALRMALQTREQHIKRDKATSNICTAQALLAIMASMYAVYHGPQGLQHIASSIYKKTTYLYHQLKAKGYTIVNTNYFDTISIQVADKQTIRQKAEASNINLFYDRNNSIVSISIDETTENNCLEKLFQLLDIEFDATNLNNTTITTTRKSDFLTADVFHKYHSETEMMRYIKYLEDKDLALNYSMISLGSCTMKLNAASEMMPCSNPLFNAIHPFTPLSQTKGYQYILDELEKYLCEITGFAGISLQPNSGAQGEYAGLLTIQAYHHANNEKHRKIALIPSSAHGTNPASASMLGMDIIVVNCDAQGNIEVEDLRTKAEKYKDTLACLMVTYPSTHGVFEASIQEITSIIHTNGGLVYMDGANMNAQVGLTNPGNIGADVCHLNLHKTFAIPHGGGGPGMGPICVVERLVPFLPKHIYNDNVGGIQGTTAVSAAPYGSALILLISYGYIRMLGEKGITDATKYAILNANYMKARLKDSYNILYVGENGHVAHEMILDCRDFKATTHVEVADIAKRLMDYGFHAPTVSFPVAGTLMIEPTESESKAELDRFIDAMIGIREEIREIENGTAEMDNNVVVNAPHTANCLMEDAWKFPYTRSKAAFPLPYLRDRKFWASVRKIDNGYGDRNLICTCAPISAYASPEIA